MFLFNPKASETTHTHLLPPPTPPCENFLHLSDAVCEQPIISKVPYSDLKHKIETYILKKKDEQLLTDIGIYFRDLNNGPTLGINEHTEFIPASMLKVGIMVAYLDAARHDLTLLKKSIMVSPEEIEKHIISYTQNYLPTQSIQPNTPYTIEDLLHRSIIYSDNIASAMLNSYLENEMHLEESGDVILETFRSLGLLPNIKMDDALLSTKRYAQIFSILYYSSYLGPEESEYALELLTHTDFIEGLVGGVPSTTPVAHKFGERTLIATSSEATMHQLHDCGIVYYPQNPYLLCIMSRGPSYQQLETTLQDISRMVYTEIDSRKIIPSTSSVPDHAHTTTPE